MDPIELDGAVVVPDPNDPNTLAVTIDGARYLAMGSPAGWRYFDHGGQAIKAGTTFKRLNTVMTLLRRHRATGQPSGRADIARKLADLAG